jgi:hypothetical protein
MTRNDILKIIYVANTFWKLGSLAVNTKLKIRVILKTRLVVKKYFVYVFLRKCSC